MMKFEEVLLEEELQDEWEGIDAFLAYWALQADPRYQKEKNDFNFEQAAGSGDWDY